MKSVLWFGTTAFLAGCGVPAFTSAIRPTSLPIDMKAEATCVRVGRDADEVDRSIKEHYANGYRLFYVSEYTSDARSGFPTNLCFERPAR